MTNFEQQIKDDLNTNIRCKNTKIKILALH